jgi:hypothetical protein
MAYSQWEKHGKAIVWATVLTVPIFLKTPKWINFTNIEKHVDLSRKNRGAGTWGLGQPKIG